MRVIEAHDVEPALSRRAPAVDVIRRINEKSRRRRLGDISRTHRLDDLTMAAQQ